MDRCCRNSNSSEILCLSLLLTSLIMIRLKIMVLLCPQNFLYYKSMGKKNWRSVACNSEANSPIWPVIELVQYFMLVFATCKWRRYVHNIFSIIKLWEFFQHSRASHSEANSRSVPKSNSSEILYLSWLSASDQNVGAVVSTTFSHYKSMGAWFSLSPNCHVKYRVEQNHCAHFVLAYSYFGLWNYVPTTTPCLIMSFAYFV